MPQLTIRGKRLMVSGQDIELMMHIGLWVPSVKVTRRALI